MKQGVKRCLSILLTMALIFGMLPATVMAADEELPIYFFIARPGEDPDPDNGWYADYPGYTKGSAKATAAASQLDGDGIRDVNDEQIIKDYIIESTLPGGSLADFEDFGSQRLTFTNGWNSSSGTYSSDEYDIVWVAISLKTGYNRNPYRCWCSGVATEHIHIDGVLSKKVEVTKETIKLTKSIPMEAGAGGETFDFELVKLQQDANYNPTAVVDSAFTPIAMQAVIAAGQTSAAIEPVSGSVDNLTFGYYQLVEVDEPFWEPEDPVYIHIATDGSIKYSHALNAGSFVSMSGGATMENQLQTYTVTYKDSLTPASFATVVKTGLLYGVATPVYEGGTPEYADGSKYFAGWLYDEDNDGVKDASEDVLTTAQIASTAVSGDAVYVAQWEDITYTVTWMDDDDKTVLETDRNVLHGATPAYNNGGGTTDELADAKSDDQYSYTFAGWRSSLTGTLFTPGETLPPVTGDVTYVANYTPVLNSYTVTWEDEDGTLLETDEDVPYGTTPTYDNELGEGTTAQLALAKSDKQYTYRFDGWDPELSPVTGDITYTATYAVTTNSYTVTWTDHNGTVLDTDSVEYGDRPAYTEDEPSRPDTAYFSYTFIGWKNADGSDPTVYDSDDSAFPAVTDDVTYVAQYEQERLLYTGTVNIYLDGALIDDSITPELLLGSGYDMYLGNDTDQYELERSNTADYAYQNTEMPNGDYYVLISDDGVNFTQLCEQVLTIDNASRERESYFWSVTYDANGGDGEPDTEYYHDESEVYVSQEEPTRDGYIFLGWEEGNDLWQPGDKLTDKIEEPYELVARWVKRVNVNINVTIDHTDTDGGHDTDADTKDEVVLQLVEKDGTLWKETGHSLTLSDDSHPRHDYETDPDGAQPEDVETTYYTAQDSKPTFTGLRGDKTYTVTADKNHYEVVSIDAVQDNAGDWTIHVELKYAPEDFDLEFSVEMASGIPAAAYPDAAVVKVLYWAGNGWEVIPQQDGNLPGVRVQLQSGSGTGSGTVPQSDGSGDPYGYRISVVSFIYDGTAVPASSADYVTYVDDEGIYTAEVQDVTGGQEFGAGLDGAYYDGSDQAGLLLAVVTLDAYDVVFHANDANATINGGATDTLADQYKAPDDLSGYVPVHTGSGYVFGGWYANADCTVPAVLGQRLSADVNYYAKWIAPFTVAGSVDVDGYYTLDNTDIPIPDGDRMSEVTVLLQKYHPSSGYFATVRTKTVGLTYTNGTATVEYEFTDVPNDGSIYRVQVLSHNYKDTYRNEMANGFGVTLNNIKNCPSLAVDEGGTPVNTAVVDVRMAFDPEEFELWYKVDASAIGAGFRPDKATVLVLCDNDLTDSSSPRQWPVISQMTPGGVETGQTSDVGVPDSYPVWKFHPLNYPYDYAIKVQKVDSKELDGSEPFTVEYNGTAEYADPGYASGKPQTQLLVAALKPNTYPITYYLMQGSDNILPGMTVTSHTWSFETLLTDVPTRVGYVFNGWVDENGDAATKISADTAEETKLYATWKTDNWKDDDRGGDALTGGDGIPDEEQVCILYTAGSYGSTDPAFEIVTIPGTDFSDVSVTATFGSTPTAHSGYAFDKWEYKGSSDAGDNATAAFAPDTDHAIIPTVENADGGKAYTFEVTFDVDDKGDEDTGGSDGIPDKYQAFVEFVSGNTAHGTVTGTGIRQTFHFGTATFGTVDPDLSGVTVTPAAKYAFDHWHHDGDNLTHGQVEEPFAGAGGTTYVFSAHFSVDEWKDDPAGDTDEEGDGVPDNRQVLVKYIPTANHLGAVTGSAVQVFTLTAVNGVYVGDIDPDDNVTAVPNSGYAFDYWGDPDGFWGEAGGKVTEEQAFGVHEDVAGGRTLVYVAHFGVDKWDDPDDNETDGDGIPDSRQILLRYASSDTAKGTVTPAAEVITLTDAVRYAAHGSAATALSGYAFDRWAYIQSGDVDYTPSDCQLAPVINNPVGGTAYEFFASFDTDEKGGGDDGTESDGIPDKYQAFVQFVSADTTLGTVTGSGIYQTFTFKDSNGNYTSSGRVEPSLADVTVKALGKNTFGYWTINDDPTKLSDSEIEAGSDAVPGGVTILIAAHFDKYVYVPTTGKVLLTKVDSVDTDKTLSNVVFGLYEEDGTKVGTYTTDANGRIVEILHPGEYYWKEIRPAEGYMMLTEPQYFSIEAGETTRMTLTNTHAKVPDVFGTDHYAFVIGSTDGLVHPEANITRAEVATIYFRMLNEETRARYLTTENNFSDVNEGDWYNTAVSTMAAMGVIGGYPDGTFRPAGNITRAEFIAFAAHFDPDGNRSSSVFTDIEGHWAEVEINIAANNGWTLGDGTNLFRPDTLINRAEAMALINRVLQRIPESTDDLLDDMIVWPDNMDTSKWYYLAVQEASNSHAYVRKPNGYEYWTVLTEVPDWTQYER